MRLDCRAHRILIPVIKVTTSATVTVNIHKSRGYVIAVCVNDVLGVDTVIPDIGFFFNGKDLSAVKIYGRVFKRTAEQDQSSLISPVTVFFTAFALVAAGTAQNR